MISCSIEKQSGWKNPRVYFSGKSRRRSGDEGEEDVKGDAAKVHCEVETVSWRERRIKAEVVVNAEVEKVWNALTDYERLADFIPNLIYRWFSDWFESVGFEIEFVLCLIIVGRIRNWFCLMNCGDVVGGYRVRIRGGYGWSREDCSELCIGILKHELFWICRSLSTRYGNLHRVIFGFVFHLVIVRLMFYSSLGLSSVMCCPLPVVEIKSNVLK